jgi:hypothetical protein
MTEMEASMHTFLRAAALSMVLLALSGITFTAQGTDPVVGTWELNVAKSKYSPGPAPKSEMRTYVVAGQDIKAAAKGVDGAGKPTSVQWTVNYDGKDRPEAGTQDADAISLTRIDAFNSAYTQKKAGKVVLTGTRSISRDGKVMTITTKGTNAQGQAVNDVEIFEKR